MRTSLFVLFVGVFGCSEYRAIPPWPDAGMESANPEGVGEDAGTFEFVPVKHVKITGESPVIQMLYEAERQSEVPAPLSAVIGYLSSRYTMVESGTTGESEPRCGIMQVPLTSLGQAAQLIDTDPWVICQDQQQNIIAGAVLLRSLRGESLDLTFAGWETALNAYGGYGFADRVRTVTTTGISYEDGEGLSIEIPPWPEFLSRIETGEFALRPDYNTADWVAAHPTNYRVANRGLGDIDQIIVHVAEGSYNGTISWFSRVNPNHVAAHFVVSTDGDVTQMVEIKDIGHHDSCRDARTIGIEHEGHVNDPARWYTDEMYQASAELVAWLVEAYDLSVSRAHVLGHGDGVDCSDHTDPGDGWNWDHYMTLVLENVRDLSAENCGNDVDDNNNGIVDCRDPACFLDPVCTPRIDSVSCTGFYPGNRRGGGATCEVRGDFVEAPGELVERLWIDCLDRTPFDPAVMRDEHTIVTTGLWRCNCSLGSHSAAYAIPGSPSSSGCDDPWGACLADAVTIIRGCDGLVCGRDFCGNACGECPDGCECTWEQWCDCADRCIASPIASCEEPPACEVALDAVRFVEGSVSPANGVANETEFVWRMAALIPGDESPTATVLVYNPSLNHEFPFAMQLVRSEGDRREFEYRGRPQDELLYEYRFRIETCAGERIEDARRVGPDTRVRGVACEPQPEVCNNADDDCDDDTDEGIVVPCRTACEEGVQVCEFGEFSACTARQPQPEVCDNTDNDCDGNLNNGVLNACGQCGLVPVEVCDGNDNDCDRRTDEDCPCAPVGAQQACGSDVGECRHGMQTCGPNGWGVCAGEVQSVAEVCDARDNNCDGNSDNGFDVGAACTVGIGACARNGNKVCKADHSGTECNVVAGRGNFETCNNADDDCDGNTDEDVRDWWMTDCGAGWVHCERGEWVNDTVPEPQPEVCDGEDNDCDHVVDMITRECESACGSGRQLCVDGDWWPCDARDVRDCTNGCGNHGERTCAAGFWGACNAPACQPPPPPCVPQAETCDGRDNDCDDIADEGFDVGAACTVGIGACARNGNKVCMANHSGTECNAVAGQRGVETCNNLDDDCDGIRDDNVTRNCSNECRNAGTQTCNAGAWGACNAQACPPVCVPQAETCNREDDDCNGLEDDNVFRNCQNGCEGSEVCENGIWGPCSTQLQPETCNNRDDDCDRVVDDGLTRQCQTICGIGVETCIGGGWVNCSVRQPTNEICNNADDDCNGWADDNLFRACQNGCGGIETCNAGVWSACTIQPQPEVCDNDDDNCNDISDDGAACPANHACQGGQCVCTAATFWDPSSMSAADSRPVPDLAVELTYTVRETAGGALEGQVCSATGTFQNQIHVSFEEESGIMLFDGVLDGRGFFCTPWGRLSNTELWTEDEWLTGGVTIVSPSHCVNEWEVGGAACRRAPNPGCGYCWFMTTPDMWRTCRE
ncbi:hypothetical protein A3H75_00310 [Candidatus Uhrbacteria bacterium RIFCSPLOWO2_02_FULL_51_9]|uniref:N-acetylmuramoyl-L-alanine amidase n=1 Tax=Candidatus Uhrbacteria bacterium RIFCSPLOWO2_02_FULL_51_9 TaxID=1802410 RepID=A0A1F7VEZ4_9BACT|nr:MAG: hypothetical protein A3H75_00310 [Candidatus Uhrbacteria bacterium RIFCSPLOWO2_02_FULL_51_9]